MTHSSSDDKRAEQGARANAGTCHDPCGRTARASSRRGSPLTLDKALMTTFNALYRPMPDAAEELRPLLEDLHAELQRTSPKLSALKEAMKRLLAYLASEEGKTDANCQSVDHFLGADDAWDAERLPSPYADILADMCGALHDTVSAPEIAINFESTPEQLLERTERL